MDKQSLRKADLITSVILFAVSTAGCIMSVQMIFNTLANGRKWYESAGLFPTIVTVLLGACSVSLFLRARKDGASFDFLTLEKIKELLKKQEFKTGSIVVGLLALYIVVMMLPGRQYEVATFLYMFISMMAFQKRTRKSMMNSVLIALIATVVLAYGFGSLAYVPLP